MMAFASSKALPSTPDFFTRSEPARSTRNSLPLSVRGPPLTEIEIMSTYRGDAGEIHGRYIGDIGEIEIMSTAWERLESAFILVHAVFRFSVPRRSSSIAPGEG